MSGWIKICGLRSDAALGVALDARVDAVGFVFHRASPRNIDPAVAMRLACAVPADVLRVAVTRHPSQAEIDAIFAEFTPDALQTDAADLERLLLPRSLMTLPVLRSGAARPDALPGRILFEGPQSGSGATADWDAARALAGCCEVILAGGLSADNVAEAIVHVRPFGVDVSSGVESAPGVKDPIRIYDFVAAARAAWAN